MFCSPDDGAAVIAAGGHRGQASPVFGLSVIITLGLAASAICAPPPATLWKIQPISTAELESRIGAVDRDAAALPTAVRPAVEFQKVLLRIGAEVPVTDWRPQVEKVAKASGDDSVSKALRELALCWEARARMQEIDAALRRYYRRSVNFPERLEEVRDQIPADAKSDPWGETWIYKATAPQGFTKLARQRYQLGPSRHPQLSSIAEFLKSKPATLNWKITTRNVGGNRALEIHTADGKAAVVEAGGRVGDAIVAYVGDGWVLLADTERLSTVTF